MIASRPFVAWGLLLKCSRPNQAIACNEVMEDAHNTEPGRSLKAPLCMDKIEHGRSSKAPPVCMN